MSTPFKIIAVSTITLISSSFQSVDGQNISERYLRYEKTKSTTINEFNEQAQIDTEFKLVDMIWRRGSKWFRKGILVKNSWRQEIEVSGEKNKVIVEDGKSVEAVVTYDSLLNPPKSVNFVLVPISHGIKVTPFNGQLVWTDHLRNGKMLFEQKGLKLEKKIYSQNSCAILPSDSVSVLQFGETTYGGDEEGNIIFSESTGTIFQIVKNSDSVVVAYEYPYFETNGGRIVSRVTFKKRTFPSVSFVNEVHNKLIGNWVFSKGYSFKLRGFEPMNCVYNFKISNNELIIGRYFKDLKFKDKWDTLNYQLNPSADYLILNKSKHDAAIRSILIEKINSKRLVLVVDDLWLTPDGLGNRYPKVLIELRKE